MFKHFSSGFFRRCTLPVLLFFSYFPGIAQNSSLSGIVRDVDGKAVAGAGVQLLHSPDSTVLNEMITDTGGRYIFNHLGKGFYLISVTHAGLKKTYSEKVEILSDGGQQELGVLVLKMAETKLKDITVVARKALYEQKTDRLVINVKGSISDAAGTALDVLQKSPGVTVDRQANSIAVNGKTGISVMINGKMTYMPNDALIQFLAGIPAGNIERIELIAAPSAKYDASGNGGLINIVLISNSDTGFNGSWFLTAGYGLRESAAAGLNFNYRTARLNLSGNYSFTHDHVIQTSTAFTQYSRSGHLTTNQSFSNRDAITQVQNFRIGLDYQMNTNTTISMLAGGYNSVWSMVAENGATVSRKNIPDSVILSTDNPEINHWQNLMANLSIQHNFKRGKALYLDASYIFYHDNNPNTYSTDYYAGDGRFLQHEDAVGGKITPIHFQVFSADFTSPLSPKISMEAGGKISLSSFDNEVSVAKLTAGRWLQDSGLSANYHLVENIGALYALFTMKAGSQTTITAGLRYEYTFSNMGNTQKNNLLYRYYGDLFPTFQFSKKINAYHSVNFSYSRRITRPGFNDLAPFTIFFDPKTFYSGNPDLQPAIANSVQAGYGFRNYSLSVGYTHEIHNIDNFYFQTHRIDTLTGIVYLSARNYNYQNYLTVSLSLPVNITSWWTMQNNLVFNWRRVNTASEEINISLNYPDYNLSTTQRLIFSRAYTAELTAIYSSAGYFGTAKRQPLYQISAGLQKKLKGDRDVLRFIANDVFNSGGYYQFGEVLPASGAVVNRTFDFANMSFRFSFTHQFGSRGLTDKKQRTIGAEEELQRVHN